MRLTVVLDYEGYTNDEIAGLLNEVAVAISSGKLSLRDPFGIPLGIGEGPVIGEVLVSRK